MATKRWFKTMSVFGWFLILLLVACGSRNHPNDIAKRNNFIVVDNDPQTVPLDKSNRLVGDWVLRLALHGANNQIILGTAKMSLKHENDNLFFEQLTWHKMVEPQIKLDTDSGKKSAVTLKTVLAKPTKAVIPTSHDSDKNDLQIYKVSKAQRLVEFKLDLTKDPVVSAVATSVTKGLMWISRDVRTIIGSNGADLFFIAQKDVDLKDATITSLTGHWAVIGFKLYPASKEIETDEAETKLEVATPTTDLKTSFKGRDESRHRFNGTIFMPDKSMGASIVDFTTDAHTKDGGFLLSPDGKYIYGLFFPDQLTHYHEQFVGVKYRD